ncbi:hypothetical protein WCD74_22485 [Actinomycetospora sp. OC33-EN08]|uniref:J domain-containing protein n=1 Tax=Actinomycetospora aurantiaca TaxID=3129233 RepID=A0ABU8MTH3_9PSEU
MTAEFRAFVRRHHPDVGGDPETFRRGLEAFRAGRAPAPGPSPSWHVADDDPRLDAPVVAVSGHVVPRTLRAGRRWLGRAPLSPVRTRRVV